MDGQRELLEAIGITPLPPERETHAKAPKTASSAFDRGIAALAQYKARTGSAGPISRSHIEVLPDGTEARLGVWTMNLKSRRTKLTPTNSKRWLTSGWSGRRRSRARKAGRGPIRATRPARPHLATGLQCPHRPAPGPKAWLGTPSAPATTGHSITSSTSRPPSMMFPAGRG
jgi:hypothetical protein